jgi:hypothetical protein
MNTTTSASAPAAQPLNQAAVVEAALRAMNNAYDSSEWMDFAQAIRENPEAKEELEGLLGCGSEGEDGHYAFGVGMVAGMLYAASTGITLKVPPLAELKAALEAQEAQYEAWRATPGAPEAV